MTGALILPLAALSTGGTVLLTAAASIAAGAIGFLKFRPERDQLIAQASEHATNAMSKSFDRLEAELGHTRTELGKTQADYRSLLVREQALLAREQDLMRRLAELESDSRREREQLRSRIIDLEVENAVLERELLELKATG